MQNQIATQTAEQNSKHVPCLNTLSESFECKDALWDMLERCYDLLNTYGKTIEKNLARQHDSFILVLGKYDGQAIVGAFSEHLRTSSIFPTPSDIVKLIEPEQKPLDKSMYLTSLKYIKDHKGSPFTVEEAKHEKYVKAYEAQQIKTLESNPPNMQAITSNRVSGLISNVTQNLTK